jgi:hypothetical protein
MGGSKLRHAKREARRQSVKNEKVLKFYLNAEALTQGYKKFKELHPNKEPVQVIYPHKLHSYLNTLRATSFGAPIIFDRPTIKNKSVLFLEQALTLQDLKDAGYEIPK